MLSQLPYEIATLQKHLIHYAQLEDVPRKTIIISILVVYITYNYIILLYRKFLKSITTITMIFMAYDNFLFIYLSDLFQAVQTTLLLNKLSKLRWQIFEIFQIIEKINKAARDG